MGDEGGAVGAKLTFRPAGYKAGVPGIAALRSRRVCFALTALQLGFTESGRLESSAVWYL